MNHFVLHCYSGTHKYLLPPAAFFRFAFILPAGQGEAIAVAGNLANANYLKALPTENLETQL